MEKNKEKEVTIISAFFDIGRNNYGTDFKRSNNKYVDYFKFWARIKNKVIIYTDKEYEEIILDIRDSFGLKDRTKVIVIDDIYKLVPEVYNKMCEIENSQDFKDFRYVKNNPESRAKYNYIMFLKTWCMYDANKKGLIDTEMSVWLDFGFNHGGEVYADEKDFDFLWKYPFEDKVYLFTIKLDENKPIFKIVQNGEVYASGTPYFVSTNLIEKFYKLMYDATISMLDMGLMDDDQTILLMAYRKNKEIFIYEQNDWFLSLKRYGCEHMKLTEKPVVKKSFKDKLLTKYRINKRNKIYLKGIKRSFLKDYLD